MGSAEREGAFRAAGEECHLDFFVRRGFASQSFDVKPELNKHAGKSITDTPFAGVLDPAKVNKNIVGGNPAHGNRKVLMPLNTGYQRYGKCGLEVGDWFANIGKYCADDIAVVRSLW